MFFRKLMNSAYLALDRNIIKQNQITIKHKSGERLDTKEKSLCEG